MKRSGYYYQKFLERKNLREGFDASTFAQDPMGWFASVGWVIPPELKDQIWGMVQEMAKSGQLSREDFVTILENLAIIKKGSGEKFIARQSKKKRG